jgi:hypothetical protein
MNVFEPQQRALGLTDNPHRVELSGRPEELVWPDVCPNCGAEASESIRIEKVFFRAHQFSDDPSYHVITGMDVPFCDSCAGRHLVEEPGMTPLQRRMSTLMSPHAIPMSFSALAALFCLKEALAHPADTTGLAVMGGMALVFLLISYGSWRASRTATRRLRIPAQTSVTLAFDFSDDLSEIFDESRRLYAIRNERFATEFESLNRDRVWQPGAPNARAARARRKVVYYAVAAIAIATTVWGWLQ